MSTGRIVGVVVAIVVLGGGAVGIYAGSRAHKGPAYRFETVPAERGKLVAKVTATGTLSALVTVQVGSQVSGRISKLNADFNSTVKKGQVIARIDPQFFVAAVEQARANRVAAEGSLAKAKAQAADAVRQYRRSKTLLEQKLVAQADNDTALANQQVAEAAIIAAEGTLAQARAAQHQAEINLDYATIVSPIDGVVISRNVDVGQTVAASFQSPTLFTIAEDLQKMQVDTNVAEADVGKLRPDMTATFTVDAYPSDRFRGVVRQIRNAPQTLQNVVTYDAVIDVENKELKLKPGMTANVSFVYAEKDGILKVPNAALRFRPPAEYSALLAAARSAPAGQTGVRDGGARVVASAGVELPPHGGGEGGRRAGGGGPLPERRTVWILHGLEPAQVSVKTGVSDGTSTEIVDGALKVGDLLVTEMAGGESKGAPGGGGPPGGMRRVF